MKEILTAKAWNEMKKAITCVADSCNVKVTKMEKSTLNGTITEENPKGKYVHISVVLASSSWTSDKMSLEGRARMQRDIFEAIQNFSDMYLFSLATIKV